MLRRPFDRKSKTKGSQLASPSSNPDFSSILGGYELPSFPAIVAQALEKLGDPSADMSTVAAIIELDPGASARLLTLVNSVSFAPRTRISSVHQGAMILGRNQLEALLISIGARGVLPSPDCGEFDEERFWSSATKRAVLASLIAEKTDPTRRSENFTAALLEDMAIPVLALRKENYGGVLDTWHTGTDDLADIEESAFGWNHGEVASWMGDKWNFPSTFVDFMGSHHSSEPLEHLLPARVVAPLRETGPEGDEEVIEEGSMRLGLATDDISAMLAAADDESRRMATLLA